MVKTLNGTPYETNGLNGSNVDQRLRTPMYGVPFNLQENFVKTQKNHSNSIDNKSGLIALLVLILIGVVVVVWIGFMNSWQFSSSKQEDSDIAAINSCLGTANQTFNEQWPDGETKNLNDGHRINMDYLNRQIDCYSNYNQTGTYTTEIDRIKDRKSDELSSHQIQSQAATDSRSNRTSCITNAVGSTAYTNCY